MNSISKEDASQLVAGTHSDPFSVLGLHNIDGQLVIRVARQQSMSLEDLLAGITDLNLHGEIETGDAVGGEHW